MEVIPKTFKFTSEEVEAMGVVSETLDKIYDNMTADEYAVGYDDSEIGSAADLLKNLYKYLINNCNKVTLE